MTMHASLPEHDLDLLVTDRETVADGVVRLTLRDVRGGELPHWDPGAHIELVLASDLVRQYSLCGDPSDRTALRIAVLREPAGRGGSAHVHDRLAVGDHVRARGPRNHFPLVRAERYLFVAGGIGITPLLPMIASVDAGGARWRLVYGGRSRDSMAFLDRLTGEYGASVLIRPQDEAGLLDIAGLLDETDPDTAVYCCGPESLLAAVERQADTRGLKVRAERFAPKAGADDGPKSTFEVELAKSGRTLTVPAERSVLDVLVQAGVDVAYSCEEGTCGTCETTVLAGVPDHRDSLLSPEEQAACDVMMICVSRSRSPRLVLDL
jgi:ferredoxin-NADP reductase